MKLKTWKMRHHQNTSPEEMTIFGVSWSQWQRFMAILRNFWITAFYVLSLYLVIFCK